MADFPITRLRRLRYFKPLRDLVRETHLLPNQFMMPLFIRHGQGIKKPISTMPGHFQFSIDQLRDPILDLKARGINSVLLFGIPALKDAQGSDSCSPHGIIQNAIQTIKAIDPNLIVATDVCLCEYTDHGHCGLITANEQIDNDSTLEILAQQALTHAQAGADIVAPSGMMDGMIQAIRQRLDTHHFQHLPILSYAVKYASHMYGPFREAAEGAPKFGDRRSHQMNYANHQEALRECELDIQEGADMLMVKPAHTYLDVITRVKMTFPSLPLAAYHTSGEFAMIKAAAEKGWIDEQQCMLEVLTAIKRAGADFIITYFAKEAASLLG